MKINKRLLFECLNYDPKTGFFTYKIRRGSQPAGKRAGSVHCSGYRHVGFDGCEHKEHRLAWFYVYGFLPDGDIDHINGNKADNRIDNLRIVDDKLNMLNKPWKSLNTSGFRGVSFHQTERGKPKWRVRITSKGKRISIGNFLSLSDAIAARIEAENKFYGEFAPSQGCMKTAECTHA